MSSKADERIPDASSRPVRRARRTGAVHRASLGAVVLLVAAAPVLAFSLTVSGAAHTTLPSALEIGSGRVATTTTAPPTTIVPPTTIGSTTTTTVVATKTSKQTTVVSPIPNVSLEDDKGRKLDHLLTHVNNTCIRAAEV